MEMHLLGKRICSLSDYEAASLLENEPSVNYQEYVGTKLDPKYKKYIYRLALDFDCKTDLSLKEVIARAIDGARYLVSKYHPHLVEGHRRDSYRLDCILLNRHKEEEGNRVKRWHLHYTNFVILADKPQNGQHILTPLREDMQKTVGVDWEDFDTTAASYVWLIYGSKKFHS